MTRFPTLMILIILGSLAINHQLEAQSLFLKENQNGLSVGTLGTAAKKNYNGAGTLSYSYKGRADVNITYGTGNIFDNSFSPLVIPGLSYLIKKDRDGLNLSVDARYFMYRFSRVFQNLQDELNGLSLGSTLSHAFAVENDNNHVYPFLGVNYSLPGSAAAAGLGVHVVMGLENAIIYGFGGSFFHSKEANTVSLNFTITFAGKQPSSIAKD